MEETKTCPACKGSGVQQAIRRRENYSRVPPGRCGRCRGTGKVVVKKQSY